MIVNSTIQTILDFKMNLKKGRFIVIDGTDGAGKSTMARDLVSYLEGKGLKVQHTREPGGTPFCESIRDALLSSSLHDEKIDSDTELLLMFAMRNQHLKTRIIPAIERNEWIVCERWTSSTFAYQGVARGVGVDKILKMENDFVTANPDMTLIFDVSPEISRERMGKRGDLDYIEQEEQSFFEKVREGYHLYSELSKEPCFIIDASQSIENVRTEMLKTVIKESKHQHHPKITDDICP